MTPATELDRLLAQALSNTPIPEAPMPYDKIDLGHPLQHFDEPGPFCKPEFTPQEQDKIAIFKVALEDHRRAANKRDEDRDIAGLGVVFTDDGGDAA